MEKIHPGQKKLNAPRKKLKIEVGDDSRWKIVAGVVLFGGVIYCLIVIFGVLIFGLGSRTVLSEVQLARVQAENFEFNEARESLQSAKEGLGQIDLGMKLLNVVKPIPFFGQQIKGVEVIINASSQGIEVVIGGLEIGESLLNASDELREVLEVSDDISFYELPDEVRERILNVVGGSVETLEDMRVQTRLARRELARLQGLSVAPQIMNLIVPIQQILPDLESSIEFFIPLAASVREIGGVGQPKQWLVLYLNNSELRPAGGFIGVYGFLETYNGEIRSFEIQDSYEADSLVMDRDDYFVAPPQPLRDFLGVDNWYFRDANWSPDFRVSADTARQLLRQQFAVGGESVPQIDGVIGITPVVAERVLEFLGPIEVDGVIFDQDNVYDLLQFETQFGFAQRGLSIDERKVLISRLTDAVMEKLLSLSLSEMPRLFEIALSSFRDKQMGIRSSNERVQKVFESSGWAQNLAAPRNSDILMVVDANLAALKSDPVVDREINYTVRMEQGRAVARVDIKYIHRGSFTGLITRYRTFTRVFVPIGSELIKVEGHLRDDILNNPNREIGYVLTENDLGMRSFGAFTSVEPGRVHTLSFEYYLPEDIMNMVIENRYQLTTFKQMGAKDHTLTLNIDFGKNISNANPPEARADRGDSNYRIQLPLDRDLNFTVLY